MTTTSTSPGLADALPEIADELEEDTPGAGRGARHIPKVSSLVLAFSLGAATPLMSSNDPFVVWDDATALTDEASNEELFERGQQTAFSATHVFQSSRTEADTANRTRLALLARQYVTKVLSPEEEARFAIASEKVRRLIPRVTVEDFEALETMLEDIERIGAADLERRRQLGIDD